MVFSGTLARRRLLNRIGVLQLALYCLLAVGLQSTPAMATVLRLLSLEELSSRSEQILVATTVGSHSEWTWYDGAERIVTRTQLHVDEVIAGTVKPQSLIEVTTLGGRVGDLAQAVQGEARLPTGESNLLFLGNTPEGYRLVGRSQGQYLLSNGGNHGGAIGPAMILGASRQLPQLLGTGPSAVAKLSGLTLLRAKALIVQARQSR